MNILLVEPDRVLGHTTKAALEAFGHMVLLKRSAQTALDAMDEAPLDLIILELQLGTHNGVELLYELATYPEWSHIPIVVHTINAQAQDKVFTQALQQLRVQTVLYKPTTNTTKLVNVVKQFA